MMDGPNDQPRPAETPIAEPLRPASQPTPSADGRPQPGAAGATFSTRTPGPSRLRVGAVAGAAVALAVGAVATSLAATPPAATSPSANLSTSGATGAGSLAAPAVADPVLGAADDAFDHGRRGGHGFHDITVSAISGSNVTLTTDDGWTRTIAVTDSVELTKGGQDITLSELAVGDQVRIAQTRDDDGTYTVEAIAVVVPSVHGTASDVSATGFKVETRDGSVWTVTVDDSTEVRYGSGDGTLSDVTAGTTVVVMGTETGDNALTALTVVVAADRVAGTVTSKTADTIVIERRDGTSVTIHVDADTAYRVAGVDDADLGDVTVDMAIGVSGRERSDGSIDADAVVAGDGHGLRGDGFGGRGGFRGDTGP